MLALTKEILQQYFMCEVYIENWESGNFEISVKDNGIREIWEQTQFYKFFKIIESNATQIDPKRIFLQMKGINNLEVDLENTLIEILKSTLNENYYKIPEEESTLIYK